MALGALIIQQKCGYTDEETVEQITENAYLQYFLGLKEYHDKPLFDPSLMTHFRKRFTPEMLAEINKEIIRRAIEENDDDAPPPGDGKGTSHESKNGAFETYPNNHGKLILDATCAPADIRYPVDVSLLNEAREKLDKMIDDVHAATGKSGKRPRTYRRKARKAFLSVIRNKRPQAKLMRKAVGKQLRFVRRNLQALEMLVSNAADTLLSQKQKETLATIRKLYEQQFHMFSNHIHQVENRIVSISQPHVRPIVRGKKGANVEFGAKIAVSVVNGYTHIEKLDWDAFNEGSTLIESVERYLQRYGHYPEAVQADKIYRNRANYRYCEDRCIRLSGPRLGRPVKDENKQKEQRRLERQDQSERNAIEGKFGEGKRRYSLARIMARLKETAESVLWIQFLVMNLEHRLRVFLLYLLRRVLSFRLEFVV
jgi:hypothetical protein